MPKRQPHAPGATTHASSKDDEARESNGHQPVLLLVDDDARGLRALASVFQDGQYQLATATDGEEAIRLIERIKPDLVLLDVMMPGMNGFEVCRRIRALDGVAEIPILLVTALDDRQSRL